MQPGLQIIPAGVDRQQRREPQQHRTDPGHHWLIDPDNDRSLVQILNADQTRVYATVETVLIDRQQPTAHTEVTLAHTGPGNLPALTEWFYPGRQTGFEFIYPSREERKLDQAKEQTIIALPGTASQSAAGE